MEITLGNIITLGAGIVSFIFGYATLHQRVKTVEKKVDEIDLLRGEIRNISDSLQNLIGKVDIFIRLACEKEKHS